MYCQTDREVESAGLRVAPVSIDIVPFFLAMSWRQGQQCRSFILLVGQSTTEMSQQQLDGFQWNFFFTVIHVVYRILMTFGMYLTFHLALT